MKTEVATTAADARSATEIVSVTPAPIARTDMQEWSVDDLVSHVGKIHEAMGRLMKKDVHFGIIPGTDKPTLYQPGSQLLMLMFRLAPEFEVIETRDGDHLEVVSTCTLIHIPTGRNMGSATGSCSTKETRYAYRNANRKCPACGKEAIVKGKAEYGGGWVCFKRKDGCGAKFPDKAPEILKQEVGRVANPDLPDSWNGVRKVANKRAASTAVLNATGASDCFTVDMEDFVPVDDAVSLDPPPPSTTAPPRAAAQPKQSPPQESYVEAEATSQVLPDDIPDTPPPQQKAKSNGAPSEFTKLVADIWATSDVKALFNLCGRVNLLEPSLRVEAGKAYGEQLRKLKGAK